MAEDEKKATPAKAADQDASKDKKVDPETIVVTGTGVRKDGDVEYLTDKPAQDKDDKKDDDKK